MQQVTMMAVLVWELAVPLVLCSSPPPKSMRLMPAIPERCYAERGMLYLYQATINRRMKSNGSAFKQREAILWTAESMAAWTFREVLAISTTKGWRGRVGRNSRSLASRISWRWWGRGTISLSLWAVMAFGRSMPTTVNPWSPASAMRGKLQTKLLPFWKIY